MDGTRARTTGMMRKNGVHGGYNAWVEYMRFDLFKDYKWCFERPLAYYPDSSPESRRYTQLFLNQMRIFPLFIEANSQPLYTAPMIALIRP